MNLAIEDSMENPVALLFSAVKNDYHVEIRRLVASGISINSLDKKEQTALFHTTNSRIAEILLELGCNVNHQNLLGQTVYQKRSTNPFNAAFCEVLTKAGANTNLGAQAINEKAFKHDFYSGKINISLLLAIESNDHDSEIQKIKNSYPGFEKDIESLLMSLTIEKKRGFYYRRALEYGTTMKFELWWSYVLSGKIELNAELLFLLIPKTTLKATTRERYQDFIGDLETQVNACNIWDFILYCIDRYKGYGKWLTLEELMELRQFFGDASVFDSWVNGDPNKARRFTENTVYITETFRVPEIRPILVAALSSMLRSFIHGVEDKFREARGMPLSEYPWKSEMQLLIEIRKAFPDHTVRHNASPSWLGLQRFDMYFADKNIAIEYQGAQHDRPIDFFGGEIAFKANQERDIRKARLSIENGCKLFYVRPKYLIDEVVASIRDHLTT